MQRSITTEWPRDTREKVDAPPGARSKSEAWTTWLKHIIRWNGALYLSFFGLGLVAILLSLTTGFGVEPWLLARIRWGHGGGEAYEMMICVIYITWGIFLWRVAAAPTRHRTFIDFTLVANAVHFGTMFLESLFLHNEHPHLSGDVPLFSALLVLLAVAWIPVRRTIEAT